MGFQVAFLTNATKAIGIYVNIKKGKVNIYRIFFRDVERILSHSVKVVRAPNMNINNV